MRCSSILSALVFTTLSAMAKTWSTLPMPEYVDTEMQINGTMKAWSTNVQKLCFEFIYDASPSNNLEVALGTNRNEDSNLSCQDKMSLTARGVQRPNERFEVETSTDGLIIYFR